MFHELSVTLRVRRQQSSKSAISSSAFWPIWMLAWIHVIQSTFGSSTNPDAIRASQLPVHRKMLKLQALRHSYRDEISPMAKFKTDPPEASAHGSTA
jgi:hypothetical protein